MTSRVVSESLEPLRISAQDFGDRLRCPEKGRCAHALDAPDLAYKLAGGGSPGWFRAESLQSGPIGQSGALSRNQEPARRQETCNHATAVLAPVVTMTFLLQQIATFTVQIHRLANQRAAYCSTARTN